MDTDNIKPNVDKIISSLREGMEDTTPLQDTHPEMCNRQKLNSSLRTATETADVLGRCGGSMRGKLCKQLARIALPIVEQINMHHSAVIAALTSTHKIQKEDLEARISKLEAEIRALKTRSNS